jgi:hypothetical protein
MTMSALHRMRVRAGRHVDELKVEAKDVLTPMGEAIQNSFGFDYFRRGSGSGFDFVV